MSAALIVDGLVAGYEPGTPIVFDASLRVAPGEIVALLGPNGAGKSTLIKAVAGLVPVSGGAASLDGLDLLCRPAHRRVALGLAYVPQIENVFATLSVEDNLALAADLGPREGRRQRLLAALALFPEIETRRGELAGRLSGGQRQMLAVARALLAGPRVLLLDEPSAGLSPKIVGELFARIRAIANGGVGVVLVEQNVRAALAIADRVVVLVQGRNRLEGTPAQLERDPALAALYIGRPASGVPA
ncbi:MAG: ABC transporter ATP-binding protein [Proteobacteria bacterium]|nr:ABC transporter ATP-binding protein [Pseudomonadota bacterium]